MLAATIFIFMTFQRYFGDGSYVQQKHGRRLLQKLREISDFCCVAHSKLPESGSSVSASYLVLIARLSAISIVAFYCRADVEVRMESCANTSDIVTTVSHFHLCHFNETWI